MCLAIPAKVIAVNGWLATVDMMGNQREIGIHLNPDVQIGEYVLVHAGFAIEVIDAAVARETEELLLEEAQAAKGRYDAYDG
ncbi:MAG: HypC/HybG/HupF family hydrogenase formation chaperone [Peptococcaceae bacterium]|jgi:hydrogenase expression/formation protein HypC|nr:HypC/HybG/HupF family hydrogenase formation chaperone [Peptococcaceae bacterium]